MPLALPSLTWTCYLFHIRADLFHIPSPGLRRDNNEKVKIIIRWKICKWLFILLYTSRSPLFIYYLSPLAYFQRQNPVMLRFIEINDPQQLRNEQIHVSKEQFARLIQIGDIERDEHRNETSNEDPGHRTHHSSWGRFHFGQNTLVIAWHNIRLCILGHYSHVLQD